MILQKAKINKFRNMIFSWWRVNKRDLPWRTTHDPYKILVSEIMLQQTQVSRVLPKYSEFLLEFPTVYDLANASPAHILKLWKGMGYNRRALYLQRTAVQVVRLYNGIFPQEEELLLKLPGLGKYTARALLVFAYMKNIYCIDTNIHKIITHFFFNDVPQLVSEIEKTAAQLVPKGKSWEWHQALMDYGALALPSPKKNKKKDTVASPFKESTRFIRGKVIDILREEARTLAFLNTVLIGEYGKTRVYAEKIIAGLTKDGLITATENGIISLPE